MDIETFRSIILISISFSSSVFITNLWWTLNINIKKNNENLNNLSIEKDNGLLYIALAFFVWGFSGIVSQLIKINSWDIELNIVQCIFSSFNSLFLLMGLMHLEYAPKWMLLNKRRVKKYLIFFCIGMVILTLLVDMFQFNSFYRTMPDYLLSLPTAILLSYVLFVTFWKRGFGILSVFSVISLFLILFDQPAIHLLLNNVHDNIIVVMGLYSRLIFIVIICLLAYSWAQKNFNVVTEKLNVLVGEKDQLEVKVSSLQEKVKEEREITEMIKKDSVWKDVAMKTAHKIGNPIEAIDKLNKVLVKKLNPNGHDITEARDIQSKIHRALTDAKTVLSEFRTLTKQGKMKPQYCDLIEIINEVWENTKEENAELKINIINKRLVPVAKHIDDTTLSLASFVENDKVELLVDKIKMKNCFSELMLNSFHWFNKETKYINVDIEYVNDNIPLENKDIDYVKITYSDNGIGVEPELKRKIFEHFYTTYHEGTGLGLSIVSRDIELHDGIIFENGEYGKGAEFIIYLPNNLKKQ